MKRICLLLALTLTLSALLGACSRNQDVSTMPLTITMTADKATASEVTVTIHNESGADFYYTEAYSLELLDDDTFITVEPEEEMLFNEMAYLLEDLSSVTLTCDLTPYGTLPSGTYRIVKGDLSAEFKL